MWHRHAPRPAIILIDDALTDDALVDCSAQARVAGSKQVMLQW